MTSQRRLGPRLPGRLFAAVLLAALACDEDPVTPALTSGSVAIQVVQADPTVAPPADLPAPPGVIPAPADVLNHLDSARAILTPGAGTATTVTLTKGASGFTATVSNLAPATYTVTILGYAGAEVDYYGSAAGVAVTAGQTTTASITWGSFMPSPAAIATPTAQLRFNAAWTAIAGADSYKVEVDRSSSFSTVTRTNVTTLTGLVSLTDTGTYYLRVRSSNPRVPLGRPSATQTIQVVRNPGEPADNNTNGASSLGFGAAGTSTFSGLNIFPASDVDWFSIGICIGDSLNVTARGGTLTPPSGLTSLLQLYNPSDLLVGQGSGTDATAGVRSNLEGNFKVRLASNNASIGNYDLVVVVVAGPNQAAGGCKSNSTTVASVVVNPTAPAFTAIGSTISLSAQPKDAAGANVAGKTPSWSSLNPGIATVNASTGLVTAVASGQTTIVASVDGILGYAPVQVNATGAASVNTWSALSTGQTVQLNSVWGYSPNETYFAAGANGTLLRYTGSSWSNVGAGATTVELKGVFGFSPTRVYAVGLNGTILRYEGSSASVMSSGTTQHLNAIWGVSPANMFAVGGSGTILRYNGSAWAPMTSGTTQTLYGVWGNADNAVWAVGSGGTILRWDGSTWTQVGGGVTTQALYAVWGAGSSDVVAVGAAGTIVRFGGTSWSTQTSNTTQQLNTVWGSGTGDIYAAGAQGTLVRYSAPAPWVVLTSGTTQALGGIAGSFGGSVYAVGAAGTAIRGQRGSGIPTATVSLTPAGVALASAGAFTTLTAQAFDVTGVGLGGKTFLFRSLNPDIATVSTSGQVTAESAGQAVVAASVDGITGYALVTVMTPGTTPLGLTLPISSGTATDFDDAWGTGGTVFLGGADGRVRRYDGLTWTAWQVSTCSICGVSGVWGLSPTEVYATFGASVSRFDGLTWTQMPGPGAQVPYEDIWASSPRDIHAVGSAGLAAHYDGSLWQTVPSGTTQNLNAAWGTSPTDAFAVGNSGVILHWNGTAWSPMTSGTAQNLYAIWGRASNAVYVAGDGGTILRYNGSTWSTVTTGVLNQMRALWGASETDLYAVGDDGGAGRMWRFNGTTWQSVGTASNRLRAVWGSSEGDIIAGGESGQVARGARGAAAVSLSPAGGLISSAGGTFTFAAAASDIDGTPLSRAFTCASLNTAVVTVAVNGASCVATAAGSGQAIVSGSADGATGYGVVTVIDPGGATPVSGWSTVTPVAAANLRGIWGTSPTNVYAVGDGGTIQRYNGTAWSAVTPSGTTGNLLGLWGSSASDIYAFGEKPLGGAPVMHYDGATWGPVTGFLGAKVTAMWGDSPDHYWAAANAGEIYEVTGLVWDQLPSLPGPVNAMWGSARDNVVAVGAGGMIQRYDGSTWSAMPTSGAWPNLNAVWGTAANDIWAVGANGTIIHWDGSTWVQSPGVTTSAELTGIHGISSGGTGMIAVGAGGVVLRWDGGAWRSMISGTTSDLRGVWGTSASDMFAVGQGGIVLRGARTGIGPPAVPTNLVATGASLSSISLNWLDVSSNEDGYAVESCSGAACTPTEFAVLGPNAVSYQHTGLVSGTSYSYRVRGFNAAGFSLYSNTATTNTIADYSGLWAGTTSQPGGSIDFQVQGNSIAAIALAWGVPACGVQGTTTTNFGTPIDVSSGSFSRTVPAGSLSYTVNGTFSSPTSVAGTLTLNWSQAFPPACTGGASGITWSAVPAVPPSAPSTLAALPLSSTQIGLSWSDNSLDEDGFRIERCSSSACNNFAEITTVAANATAYQDIGLNGSTDYSYRVRSYRGVGTSSYSNTAAATTLPPPPVATTVTVNPRGATITGGTQPFGVEVRDQYGAVMPSPAVTWASLNSTVATIDPSTGLATAVGSGQVTMIATVDGVAGYGLLTVGIPGATPVNLWSNPPSPTGNSLWGVWTAGPNDAWAVGNGGNALHFDGNSWTGFLTGTTNALNDVWGTSGSDVYAVGDGGGVIRYNGADWQVMPSFTTANIEAIWGAAPDFVLVAAGTKIFRFDGTGWTEVLDTGGPGLNGVWGTSATDAWAVGNAGVIYRYNGIGWTGVFSPTTVALARVWGISSSEVYVAGSSGKVFRYNGTSWTEMSPTSGFFTFELMLDIWGTSSADLYAVQFFASALPDGFVFRHNGTAWTEVVEDQNRGLSGVSGSSSGSVHVVGQNGVIYRGIRGATITLAPATPTVSNPGSQQMTATATDASSNIVAGVTFVWSSSDETKATVDGTGLVIAVANGLSTICATSPGGAQGCTVVTVASSVPTAPGALTATLVAPARIDLAWADNSTNEDGFRIERCAGIGCSGYSEIATTGPDATAYIDTDLAAGTTYRYQMRAYNLAGNSGYTGTTTSSTPISLVAGTPVTNLTGAQGSKAYYSIQVPPGRTLLDVAIGGASGDADLFIQFSGLPTTSTANNPPSSCAAQLGGSTDECTISSPSAGTYYVLLYGFTAYSGWTLAATYSP